MKYKELVKKYPKFAKFAVHDRDFVISHFVSETLARTQGISDEAIAELVQLHKDRIDLFNLMKEMDPKLDNEALFECSEEWQKGEFKMQKLWGFKEDPKYHRFWNLPHCSCPSMDNIDMHPSDAYNVEPHCYHKTRVEREIEKQNKAAE